MRATVVWEALQWPSVEHVAIVPAGDGWTADGASTAVVDGLPTRLAYQITVGGDGAVRAVDVRETVGGASLALRADGAGAWRDGDGNAIAD
ncbi:MAG TPA: putative glycolipid-binding domain-containing protein, partial [Micromonosporaceae bacterium]